jgi:hypothetical protein
MSGEADMGRPDVDKCLGKPGDPNCSAMAWGLPRGAERSSSQRSEEKGGRQVSWPCL